MIKKIKCWLLRKWLANRYVETQQMVKNAEKWATKSPSEFSRSCHDQWLSRQMMLESIFESGQ